jgi:glycosyltransferase involved in cell wall biosynthesis
MVLLVQYGGNILNKMEISACVLAYMDEDRIADFINSLKGVDDIVISLDEYSTDRTGDIAESMGARVVKRSNFWVSPTEDDIKRFKVRFGYEPAFTTANSFCKSGDVRNEAMSYCKHDWVFFPDSDELVTWDLSILEKLLPLYDQIGCNYVGARDDKGNPVFGFETTKLFKKSLHKWIGRVHETPAPLTKSRSCYVPSMKIDHYHVHRIVAPDKASRNLASMEFAVISDYDVRTMNYLAREYYYNKEYKKALAMYTEYLKRAWWEPEITEAYLKMSQCHWQLQEGNDARETLLEAIKRNPQNVEALYLASIYYNEPWASRWRKSAMTADNEDVLFKYTYKLMDKLYGQS